MQTQYDSRGLALNTSSQAAAEAFNKGVHSYVCWRTDTFAHLDAAMAADPDFVLAKLAKGWILQTARTHTFKPMIEGLLQESGPLIDKANAQERAYFDSLNAAVRGHGIEAGTIVEAMLVRHPTDLLAHRLIQFEIFWNGRAEWMRDIAERAAPHWNDDLYDYGCFQSVRSFSSEEAGDYDLAERCGREAVEIDPLDCWGTHSVAHIHVMQGRVDDGIDWLEGLCGNWGEANQMGHHLWWHLCLMLLERGEHERVFELLTSQIRNPDAPLVKAAPDAPIDLQNFTSMLMRLELAGIDVGDHWNTYADICAGRLHEHGNAFSNAHDMMVLAKTGQFELADQLLDSMHQFVATHDGTLAFSHRAAGIPTCEAVLAHFRKDYARVIEMLSPARHDLPLFGGSHAQRDVFYQILVNAARHEGRTDLISLYLDDMKRIGFERVTDHSFYHADAGLAL